MRRAVAITIGAGMIAAGTALAACGAAEPGEAAGDSLPSVTSAAPADLSDGLITCAMPDFDGKTGLTVTERFILIDGQPKRYSDFNNQAFDLCQAGQDNCALKIENGVIRMDWTSANGTRSRYDVDLGTLDIDRDARDLDGLLGQEQFQRLHLPDLQLDTLEHEFSVTQVRGREFVGSAGLQEQQQETPVRVGDHAPFDTRLNVPNRHRRVG